MSVTTVTRNEQKSRYEARVDGALAGYLEYRPEGGNVDLTHTEVDPAFGGRGVGSALARHALDGIRAEGTRKVIPTCPFVKAWIGKHPAYQDLVADHG